MPNRSPSDNGPRLEDVVEALANGVLRTTNALERLVLYTARITARIDRIEMLLRDLEAEGGDGPPT